MFYYSIDLPGKSSHHGLISNSIDISYDFNDIIPTTLDFEKYLNLQYCAFICSSGIFPFPNHACMALRKLYVRNNSYLSTTLNIKNIASVQLFSRPLQTISARSITKLLLVALPHVIVDVNMVSLLISVGQNKMAAVIKLY